MKAFSLSKAYQLLEPGPVVLLTTADKGKTSVMALSWHMMVEFDHRWLRTTTLRWSGVVGYSGRKDGKNSRRRRCAVFG